MKISILKKSVGEYQQDPQALIHDIVDLVGEDVDQKYTFALRGIYGKEVGKKYLNPSYSSPDGIKECKLSGTSGLLLAGDWNYDPASIIKNNINDNIDRILHYGDTEHIAIIRGNLVLDEDYNDINEVVLSEAEVIAYIRRERS